MLVPEVPLSTRMPPTSCRAARPVTTRATARSGLIIAGSTPTPEGEPVTVLRYALKPGMVSLRYVVSSSRHTPETIMQASGPTSMGFQTGEAEVPVFQRGAFSHEYCVAPPSRFGMVRLTVAGLETPSAV